MLQHTNFLAEAPWRRLCATSTASFRCTTAVRHLYNHIRAVEPLLAADASLTSRLLPQLVHDGSYDPEMVHAAAQTVHSRAHWQQLYDVIHNERDVRPLGELNLYCLLAACARYGSVAQAAQLVTDVALDASDRSAIGRSCVAPLVRMCDSLPQLARVHGVLLQLCGERDADLVVLTRLLRELHEAVEGEEDVNHGTFPALATLALTHGCSRAHVVARAWRGGMRAQLLPTFCSHAIVKPLAAGDVQSRAGKASWWARFSRGGKDAPIPIPLASLMGPHGVRTHVCEFLAVAAGENVDTFASSVGMDAAQPLIHAIKHTVAYMQRTPTAALTSSMPCPARTLDACLRILSLGRGAPALMSMRAITDTVNEMRKAAYVVSPEEACVLMLTLACVVDSPTLIAAHAPDVARALDACMQHAWQPMLRARAGVCPRSVLEAALVLLATVNERVSPTTATLTSVLAHTLVQSLTLATRDAVTAPPRAFLALVAGETVSEHSMMSASSGAARDPAALMCVYGDRGLAHACSDVHANIARAPPVTRAGEGVENWYDDVGVWDEAVLQASRDVSVLYDARTRMRVCGDTQVGAHTLEWPQRVKVSNSAAASACDEVYLPHDHIASQIVRTCLQQHSLAQYILAPQRDVERLVHAVFDAIRGLEPFSAACDAAVVALEGFSSMDSFSRACVGVCVHTLVAAHAAGKTDAESASVSRLIAAVVRDGSLLCDAVTALRSLARVVTEDKGARASHAAHLNLAMLACAHSVKGHIDWAEAATAAGADGPPPTPLDPANVLRRLEDVIAEVACAAPRWRAHKLVYVSKMLVTAAAHNGVMPHGNVVTALLKAYEHEPSAVNTLLHQLRILGHLPL